MTNMQIFASARLINHPFDICCQSVCCMRFGAFTPVWQSLQHDTVRSMHSGVGVFLSGVGFVFILDDVHINCMACMCTSVQLWG